MYILKLVVNKFILIKKFKFFYFMYKTDKIIFFIRIDLFIFAQYN